MATSEEIFQGYDDDEIPPHVVCSECNGTGIAVEGWDCEECDGIGYFGELQSKPPEESLKNMRITFGATKWISH